MNKIVYKTNEVGETIVHYQTEINKVEKIEIKNTVREYGPGHPRWELINKYFKNYRTDENV